ncbi:hypothetical protein ECANGB1_1310 [Enterospora canceri]|uniref:Uncharacterized protein n=1 Tax=Enterospora canceri TaxID=1081671 RepID=A0A1Y1S694_9MICR|nr:hypothetical protein ECANGB1_1310 [Enterospora canceri]
MTKPVEDFNHLVYEHLVCSGLSKAAEAFRTEAKIDDERGRRAERREESTLWRWYEHFVEVADVRSASPYHVGSRHRIESIMHSLENEKKRHQEVVDLFSRNGRGGNQMKLERIQVVRLNILVREAFLQNGCIFLCDGFSIYYGDYSGESYSKIADSSVRNMCISDGGDGRVRVGYVCDANAVRVVEVSGREQKSLLTLQHSVSVKNIALVRDQLFLLDATGFVKTYSLSGGSHHSAFFEKKVVYEIVGWLGSRLLVIDSRNVLVEYDIDSRECEQLGAMELEPVLSVKENHLFVNSSGVSVYEGGIGSDHLVHSGKVEPKMIDFAMFRGGLVALKRNELVFDGFRIEVDKGHSVFVQDDQIVVVSDEGTIEVFTPVSS